MTKLDYTVTYLDATTIQSFSTLPASSSQNQNWCQDWIDETGWCSFWVEQLGIWVGIFLLFATIVVCYKPCKHAWRGPPAEVRRQQELAANERRRRSSSDGIANLAMAETGECNTDDALPSYQELMAKSLNEDKQIETTFSEETEQTKTIQTSMPSEESNKQTNSNTPTSSSTEEDVRDGEDISPPPYSIT